MGEMKKVCSNSLNNNYTYTSSTAINVHADDNFSCCSLRSHYLHLYENEIKYDAVLLCDDDGNRRKALKVHRTLLSAFCSYFKELFDMDFFIKSDSFAYQPTVIVMKSYNYKILKKVIDFLYKGSCDFKPEQLKIVRNYAYELGIQSLIDFLTKPRGHHESTGAESSNHTHHRHSSHSHYNHTSKDKKIASSCHEDDKEHRLSSEREEESQTCGDDDEDKYSPYSHDDYIMPSSPILEPLVQLVTPCDGNNQGDFDSGSEAARYADNDVVPPPAGSSGEREVDDEAVQMYFRTLTKAEERKMNPKNISKRTCPVCHKVFTRVDTMRSHFRGMHLQQKLLCDQCSMSFKWKSHLRRHYKLFHCTEETSNKDPKMVPV